LQYAAEVLQVLRWALAPTIRCVVEHHSRRLVAAGGPVIAHVHPEPPSLGLAAARFKHRYGRIVRVQLGGPQYVAPEGLDQRVEQMEALAHPLGERRALQLYAFPGVDLRLPVQRQMVRVLRHQHMGEEPCAGEASRDRS